LCTRDATKPAKACSEENRTYQRPAFSARRLEYENCTKKGRRVPRVAGRKIEKPCQMTREEVKGGKADTREGKAAEGGRQLIGKPGRRTTQGERQSLGYKCRQGP